MAEPLRPPPPPAHGAQTEALRAFSEALFKANDYVPDGLLLSINEAAMNLHKACSQPASATRSSDILERVRGQMYTNIAELHELREVNANYSEQLHSATMVIDKLRERRDYFAKCTSALKGVCIANHIADCKLLEAYDRLGVLEKVLEERERKRKRDDNGVPIEVIAISPISDEHEGEEGFGEGYEEDEYELASA